MPEPVACRYGFGSFAWKYPVGALNIQGFEKLIALLVVGRKEALKPPV